METAIYNKESLDVGIILGHCRFCDAPILVRNGATCCHRGLLVNSNGVRFYQNSDGYDFELSVNILPSDLFDKLQMAVESNAD